jgi:hypothetical protein
VTAAQRGKRALWLAVLGGWGLVIAGAFLALRSSGPAPEDTPEAQAEPPASAAIQPPASATAVPEEVAAISRPAPAAGLSHLARMLHGPARPAPQPAAAGPRPRAPAPHASANELKGLSADASLAPYLEAVRALGMEKEREEAVLDAMAAADRDRPRVEKASRSDRMAAIRLMVPALGSLLTPDEMSRVMFAAARPTPPEPPPRPRWAGR